MVGNRRHIPAAMKQQWVTMSAQMSSKAIAEVTNTSQRTVNRVLRLSRLTGSVVRRPLESGRPRLLSAGDVSYLLSCTERTPDIFLSELQHALHRARGVEVSEITIGRTLRRHGLTHKHVSRAALERNEDTRDRYQIFIAENFRPEQLVFVDESACNRITTRRSMAWSPIGMRARRHDYFIRGQRYSILPALSLDGILHLDVLDRPYTSAMFNEFVVGLLDNMNPFPQKNSVIVMDNASIHKSPHLEEMVQQRGMRIVYLPPYSPDFNPIEEAFSAIKAWIRRHHDYARREMMGELTCDPYQLLWNAVFNTVTPEKAHGWFTHSGYLS